MGERFTDNIFLAQMGRALTEGSQQKQSLWSDQFTSSSTYKACRGADRPTLSTMDFSFHLSLEEWTIFTILVKI